MNNPAEFAERRRRYAAAMGDNAVAVVHAAPEASRNGDALYAYRPSSDLFYLTGFAEPEATLVLRPGAETDRCVLFVRPRDKERETWDGRRAGVDGAKSDFGADASFPMTELRKRLPELLSGCDDLYYSLGSDPAMDKTIISTIGGLRRGERRGRRPPRRLVDPGFVLHEMRLRKSPHEIETLRRAAAITDEAHRLAMSMAAPGVHENELEAALNYTFRRRGGSGPGYTSIVGAGQNATILHYIENDQPLADGDLVLIDAGCEFDLYTADVTRTFPASGTFTDVQRRVYERVLAVQERAIEQAQPGANIDSIHDECVRGLTEAMVNLGLLSGDIDKLIEDGDYKRFYMHRTSHWLGMDVHDVGAYSPDGVARPLEAGMVLTIEPGLYIAADDEDAPAELRGIGIRIEDDILVTADGNENLTAAIPKSVAEVEKACAVRA